MDFANILFAGPCNRACPWCIGKALPARVNRSNLELFPLPGLEHLVRQMRAHQIERVVFTGTVSDPQLYRHQRRLIERRRSALF